MKYLYVSIIMFLLSVFIYADNNCLRRVQLVTFGKIDVGNEYSDLVDDSSFNNSVFQKRFGKLFPSSKLKLNVNDKPEYSITATFIKKKGRYGHPDYSMLAIVFSFNGGANCTNVTITSSPNSKGESFYQYGAPLFTWISNIDSHNLIDHVNSISSQIKASDLDSFLEGFEQIVIEAKITETSKEDLCEYNFQKPFLIYLGNFKTGVERKGPLVDLSARFFVKAENGTIENGEASVLDNKAKIYSILLSHFDGRIEICYQPPKGSDKSDKIIIYNSCEICNENYIPLSETKKNKKLIEFEVNCGNGSIDYNHKIDFNYGGFNQTVTITGSVPFNLEVSPNGTNDKQIIKGKGSVNLSLIWNAEGCTGTGNSPGEVELEGEIVNENEEKYLDIKFNEKWLQNTVMTVTCEEVIQSVTMPVPPPVKYEKMKFKLKDGEKITRSFAGMGGTGTYSWTISLPNSGE